MKSQINKTIVKKDRQERKKTRQEREMFVILKTPEQNRYYTFNACFVKQVGIIRIQIYEDEEQDNVVYSIREEIIENVLTEIDKISLEKRIYRFVAECACDALKKMISIHFYYRAAIPDVKLPPWAPDVPVPPSPPDTWATKRVPVRPRSKIEVQTSEVMSKTSLKTSCKCDIGVPCLCYLDAEGRIRDHIEVLYAAKSKLDVPSAATSERLDVEEEEEEEYELVETVDANIGTQESEKCILKEGFSKIGLMAPAVKLPKIELPPPMARDSKIEMLELPPIRVDANFHSRPVEPPKNKKQTRKKKR